VSAPTYTTQVGEAVQSVECARREVEAADHALAARREDAPAIELQVAGLRAALADPALLDALGAADFAATTAQVAERELGRCRSGRSGGYRSQRSPLALEREATLRQAQTNLARNLAALAPLLAARGLETGGEHFGARHASSLGEQLRWLEEPSEADLRVSLDSARSRLVAAEAALVEVRGRLISPAAVEALARPLEPGARYLLARLVGGYKPKPQTVRGEPLYAALASSDLVALSERGTVSVTNLGREVLRWAETNLPGVGTSALPLPPRSWRGAHSPAERRAMAARAVGALREITADEDNRHELVELGDPEQGYSYRLYRRAEVMQWFLCALGEAAEPHFSPVAEE